MADKGFRIQNELRDIGLKLNIPPLASCARQMSRAEVMETRKIASHRIHVECSINRIKNFKILQHKIPTTLFHIINEVWVVCSLLTLFQDILVQQ